MRVLANHRNALRLLERECVINILEQNSRCTCDFTTETSVVGLYIDVVVDLLVAFIGLRVNVTECFRRPRIEIDGNPCGVSSNLEWLSIVRWW